MNIILMINHQVLPISNPTFPAAIAGNNSNNIKLKPQYIASANKMQ